VHDLVIRGGRVVDGTGQPARVADVAVADGRVVAVGAVPDAGRREIDATGKVVCPGFIDIHTHYDAQLLWDTTASPSVQHGVTTVIGGNCGFSIAPLGRGDADYIQAMMAVVEGIPREALVGGGPWSWGTFAEYLERVDTGLSVNAGFLVGHSTVRRVVMGDRATWDEASPDQLAAMVALVEESLDGGALGLSSSLGEGHLDGDHRPVPSSSASFPEFVALAGALRGHEGTTLEFIPTIGPIPDDRVELMADLFDAALPADHPLAKCDSIDLAELATEIFVAAAPGTSCSEVTLATCAAAGFSPDVRHYSTEWNAIGALVAVGAGVALVPRLAQPLNRPGVVMRPLRQHAARNIFAAVRAGAQEDPVLGATLEVLVEVAASVGAVALTA